MSGHSHTCCNGCDHTSDIGCLNSASLFKWIDINKLTCLNESITDSGKKVFKSYENRTDRNEFVESDTDEELLFNIPFTGLVRIKGIIIASSDDDDHPKEVALFCNNEYMDFSSTSKVPSQSLILTKTSEYVRYPLNQMKFNNVKHLSLHVKTNYGSHKTRIQYIGLFGGFLKPLLEGIVITNYEITPNIADHKTSISQGNTSFIS